jgi:methylmalonyl-CoA epimerase
MKPPQKIHHLGHAVRDLDRAVDFYQKALGAGTPGEPEVVEDGGVIAVMLPVGGSLVELLQPARPDSPVGRFLESRGEGLHHVAYEVESLESALRDLEAAGLEPLDREPRTGAGGARVAFLVHPKQAAGVLVELVEASGVGP